MTRIIEWIEGHYEVHETPFARTYKWYPTHAILECDCGKKLTLSDTSTTTVTCGCGADHSSLAEQTLIQDLQEREKHLRDEVTHPWKHDAKEQTQQHLQDEATYLEGSPRRYNDVTSRNNNDV
jgi:hypothetical protein